MFTPDEYYNIVEFTGAGTRRDEVVEEIQQQQQRLKWSGRVFHRRGPAAACSTCTCDGRHTLPCH